MRILMLYIPIVVAATLPVLFRRAVGVRVLSVVILSAVALLHFTYLMAGHRIVMEDGARQLAVTAESQLPPDFRVAVDSIQKHNQQQMWPFAALTAALVFLALFPFGSIKKRAPNDDTESVERTGMSRSGQGQFQRPWRLIPVAHLCRSPQ